MNGLAYAGIGSRRTPPDYLALMTEWARAWAAEGVTLRSGHAPGADQAFERGAGENAEIFLPWAGFESDVPIVARRVVYVPSVDAYRIAERMHPYWRFLKPSVQALHARNVHQVLGADCDSPALCVLCWTPRGSGRGGTGQAIRTARAYGVPVFDLGKLGAPVLAAATALLLESRG